MVKLAALLLLAGCTAAGASDRPAGYYDDNGRLVYSTPTKVDVGPECRRVKGPDNLWRCVEEDG